MTDITKLLTAFERFAYGQSLHTAFTDLLDWTLLPFKRYADRSEQQKALDTYRNHPKVKQLAELITIIGELSEGMHDPLGELYMNAISNGHNGQYFTPEPICDMMAAMQVNIDMEDGKTVHDPACGSGRMLLAVAKLNRSCMLYGADLDITCCKMALVNMLLNSLQGEIAHMNSLSNEFYTGYKVVTVLVEGYYYPYYTEFTDASKSYMWLKPMNQAAPKFDKPFEPVRNTLPMTGVQGSLF
jgi:type I restriction-modification system DNA methylase subunit